MVVLRIVGGAVPRASPSTEYSAGIEARRLASGDRASGVAAHWWMHLVRMTEFEIVPRLGKSSAGVGKIPEQLFNTTCINNS